VSVPAWRGHTPKAWATPGFRASALAVLLVIALLSLLPMVRLVIAAIAPGGEVDFGAFAERLAKPAALRAMGHTLDTAFFGAVLAVCLGGPFAVAVTMTDLPGRKVLGFLLLLPLMIAPQVTALSWLHLFGPSSTLLRMVSLAPPPGTPNPMLGRNGIILLYAIQHAPIVFIFRCCGRSCCRLYVPTS
jgi:iron(III) transport system permease protein